MLKHRPPEVVDVLFSEMKMLQDLEQLEEQHAPSDHVPVRFEDESCQSCMCVHK